jgi:hypothetical protein
MILSEFAKQPRGITLFDTWCWSGVVHTVIGDLPVELYTSMEAVPSEEMVTLARQLATYARIHDEFLLDLIYGHYRYAEEKGWLSFWNVPAGLTRAEVLEQVISITLVVDAELVASVFINPRWEEEHKLDLLFEETITRVNDRTFQLVNKTLVFI